MRVEKIYPDQFDFYEVTGMYTGYMGEFAGMKLPPTSTFNYVQFFDKLSLGNIIITTGKGTVLSRFAEGSEIVFIDSGRKRYALGTHRLENLFKPAYFTILAPIMLFLKGTFHDHCWHMPVKLVNLTIDDPALTQPWHTVDYFELLQHMDQHDFHTTIAFIPKNYELTESQGAKLFEKRRDRYSIVQHGNNHDGYELYFYNQNQVDSMCMANGGSWCDSATHYPRPNWDQLSGIREGFTKLFLLKEKYGIPFDRVMSFPWGISPESTLIALKEYNFLYTVNFQIVPLGEEEPDLWYFGEYFPSDYFGNFKVIKRGHPVAGGVVLDTLRRDFVLFAERPQLLYSHWNEIFTGGIGGFDHAADYINGHFGDELRWASLGEIGKYLRWEKLNHDGSVTVRIWTNRAEIINPFGKAKRFRVVKHETFNVPIRAVKVNGSKVHFDTMYDTLELNSVLAAGDTCEVEIFYGEKDRNFAIYSNRLLVIPPYTLQFYVFNKEQKGGVCPFWVSCSSTNVEDTIVTVGVTPYIAPMDSVMVTVPRVDLDYFLRVDISIDPFDLELEINEDNNFLGFSTDSFYTRKEAFSETVSHSRSIQNTSLFDLNPSVFSRNTMLEYALPHPGLFEITLRDATRRRKNIRTGFSNVLKGRISYDIPLSLKSEMYFFCSKISGQNSDKKSGGFT